MGIKRFVVASLAIFACLVGASVASAQSTGLSSLARRLESQAHRAGMQVDEVFANSRLLRSMVRDTYDLEDAASQVQFLAQTGAGRLRINGQLARIEAELNDLCRLVDLSESRSQRGIDPPICGCIDTLRQQLAGMRCTHDEMVRALDHCGNGQNGGFSGAEPILLLEPPRSGYGSGYGNGYGNGFGSGYGNGYGNGYGHDPYDGNGFSGRGNGGMSQDGFNGSLGNGGRGGNPWNEPGSFDSRPVGNRPSGERPVGNRPQGNRPQSFNGNGPTVMLTPDGVRVDGLTFDLGRLFN